MNHLEFAARESYVSPEDHRWETWIKHCEVLLGHDLDGDQKRDGYSMDFAHDAFLALETPEQYVAEVRRAQKVG